MILGRKLQELGIGFIYFFGSMGMETRQKAVAAFGANKDAKVMVSIHVRSKMMWVCR